MENAEREGVAERYSRQIALQEIGEAGQKKLLASKVAVVGLGGLGSVSTLMLSLAGVGFLRLIDLDTVEPHNLHRQALYTMQDLRLPKVEAARNHLSEINPQVQIDAVPENIRQSNVEELIEGVDCVVDGLDNMSTRYILNQACTSMKIPFIYGGAIGLEGNVSVFDPPQTPCLQCVFPDLDDRLLPTCDTRGVLGATVGTIGSVQALEAIKVLADVKDTLRGRLLVADLKGMDFFTLQLYKAPNCPVCGEGAKEVSRRGEQLTWLCGRDTINVNPSEKLSLNLEEAREKVSTSYKILVQSPMVLVFTFKNNVEVSLFRQGRMLLKNISSEDEALKVYSEVIKTIA